MRLNVKEALNIPELEVERAVENALGGVLFIDEAYALVREGKDPDICVSAWTCHHVFASACTRTFVKK